MLKILFCWLLAFILSAPCAMAAGKLPFGLGWGDSIAQIEATLKKKTTNVHFVKDANLPADRVIIEARKFYDDHPFTVRCGFYRNKLRNIAIYAYTAGFKNNLQRAGDLAKKIFLPLIKKYPNCFLLHKRPNDGGQKFLYSSDRALVDLSWGKIKKTSAGLVLVILRRPKNLDNPFRDSGIYSAQLNKKFTSLLSSVGE